MTTTLDTKLVTDWCEVLPIVKPFYERFFGEEMLLRDINLHLADLDEETAGRTNLESGAIDICLNIPVEDVPKTLVHELAHKKYEEATGIGMFYYEKAKTIIPFLRGHYRRKKDLNWFLHECVAKTVGYLFSGEDIVFNCKRLDGSTTERTMYATLDSALSDINSVERYGFNNKPLNKQLNERAMFVGKYLAIKYENDPDLWSKLKQLRTLDDLKELVECET